MDDYEYDYFMVRVRRPTAGTGRTVTSGDGGDGGTRAMRDVAVSGVAERLDTGEKHLFRNGAELLEVMLGGHPDPKLPRDSGNRNDATGAAAGR